MMMIMGLTILLGAVSMVESFVVPKPATSAVIHSTQLWVLADPPSKEGSDEEMFFDEDELSFEHDEMQEEESSSAGVGQPIRRLRRDKKEPLIAVVGRPNVVSLFFAISIIIGSHAIFIVSSMLQEHLVSANLDPNEQEACLEPTMKKLCILPFFFLLFKGKSALVNRIAETQSGGAIVADESGITRDRTYRQAEFLGEVCAVL